MIRIVETPNPIKLSGRTSFLVFFPEYDPELVAAINRVPSAKWHKRERCWEVAASDIAQLLDSLVVYSDLSVKFFEEPEISEISSDLSEAEIANLKFTPFKHQIEGVNFGLAKKKWLLLDNPGCGKTNQIIALAETLKNRGEIDHCLVIVGVNSLKSNWKKEIKTFSNEDSLIIGEKIKKNGTIAKTPTSIADRVARLKQPISEFFVIINIESLRDSRIIDAIMKGPNKFGMIAIDEVHKCLGSGKSAQQSVNTLKLKADYMVGATGTLLVNNPMNAWGPLVWTDNDHSTLTNFKGQYCNFGGFNNREIIGYKNLELLKDELSDCSLRRRKEDLVDLPPKIITVELLDMNENHRKFYEAIESGVREEVNKIELNTSNLLALTTRLRQATADPMILTTNEISSTKIERCVELVQEIVENGEKVVVFSVFKPPLYQLEQLLAEYKPLLCTGDQPDKVLSDNIEAFQNDNEHMVLLGSHSRLGTGHTLNRATYLICLDTPYTYAGFDQSVSRIHRINNTGAANVKVLSCRDTIDERVWELVTNKKDLSDYVIDGEINETFASALRSMLDFNN